MPKFAKRRSSALSTQRSGPRLVSAKKVGELKSRLVAVSKRTANVAAENDNLLCSVGAAAALAYAEKESWKLPDLMGIDPALVMGVALYVGGRKMLGGKTGKRIEAAGQGLLTVGIARAVKRGGVKVKDKDGKVIASGEYDGSGGDDDDDDLSDD